MHLSKSSPMGVCITMVKAYLHNTAAVTSETFETETVIINFLNGCYFSLGGSAPAIWNALATPRSREELVSVFAGENSRAEGEIHAFLDTLVAENCLVVADAKDAAPATFDDFHPGSYAVPTVQVFHDLKELIVLDPVHEVDEIAGWPHVAGSLIKR